MTTAAPTSMRDSREIDLAAATTPCIGHAPFLVWLVARREIYASIAVALGPALAWGLILFGWRAGLLICCTLASASICHILLWRFTWRGKAMVYSHSLLYALILAALCNPSWPWAILAIAGAALVVLIWIGKGPGLERINPVLLTVLIFFPLVQPFSSSAILLRDHLVTGDLHEAGRVSGYHWPRSDDSGLLDSDAVQLQEPWNILRQTYVELQQGDPEHRIEGIVAAEFPWPATMLGGAFPGAIGVVSALAIIGGGLYLVYRNILRPRSCAFFLAAVGAGLVMAPLSESAIEISRWHSFAGIWTAGLERGLLFIIYEILSFDVLFAAIFIMALPGTLPITRRGRRWFIFIAGLGVAFAHRLLIPMPAATIILLCLQPASPLFDRFLARRSWLASGRATYL